MPLGCSPRRSYRPAPSPHPPPPVPHTRMCAAEKQLGVICRNKISRNTENPFHFYQVLKVCHTDRARCVCVFSSLRLLSLFLTRCAQRGAFSASWGLFFSL